MTNHAETIQQREGVAVVVYSKPQCVQCDATYRKLDKHQINYAIVDITEDPEAHEFLKGLGYLRAPVVFAALPEGKSAHWSGYIPSLIEKHITHRPDVT